eukprot:gene18957-26840_t
MLNGGRYEVIENDSGIRLSGRVGETVEKSTSYGPLADGDDRISSAGAERQKALYIPRMIDGRWTGTMNLTEPQAGSDLSMVRTRAVPQGDGSYRLTGQKIYITYGEHDLAENIAHLVLARTPEAPPGVKGISLFLCPKFLVSADGTLGARNDVFCASIEHKLGIKASPTAVLVYGDDKGEVGPGAIGYLVGQENRGLEYMFIMMNAARYAVGVQGIAVAQACAVYHLAAAAYGGGAVDDVVLAVAVGVAGGEPVRALAARGCAGFVGVEHPAAGQCAVAPVPRGDHGARVVAAREDGAGAVAVHVGHA